MSTNLRDGYYIARNGLALRWYVAYDDAVRALAREPLTGAEIVPAEKFNQRGARAAREQ